MAAQDALFHCVYVQAACYAHMLRSAVVSAPQSSGASIVTEEPDQHDVRPEQRRPAEPKAVPDAEAQVGPPQASEGAASGIPNNRQEPWHIMLRRARESNHLTRPATVLRLRRLAENPIAITADTIRKNEAGKAKPRPKLRAAYAELYGLPSNFPW